MAKNRMVNTRFWDDSYVARMGPNEKLVFLYLLTNPLTTIAGVYELSARRASFDTGLSQKEIGKVLEKLDKDGKIIRIGDWIGIVNFIRYQSLNPKVRKGIQVELEKAPKELIDRLGINPERFAIGLDSLSHSNPNINLNSKDFRGGDSSTDYPQDVQRRRRGLVRGSRI